MSQKSDAHILFNLTAANDGQLSMKKYVETDVNFLGLKVPNVGFPILEEPNQVLDKKHQTKLPGIIGWNLIWLTYKVFVDKYGEGKFNSLECLAGVNPLLFSQLCLYYYAEISREQDYGVWSVYHQTDKDDISPKNQLTWLKKVQPSFIKKHRLIGQVTIGTKQQPICIPGNSTITILGCTNKLPPRIT